MIEIKNSFSTYINENILLGGDFNFYLNPNLDKLDSMSNKNDNTIYRNEVLFLLDSINLVDCFRTLYLNLRRYTWHARGKSTGLDHWFISENLLNDITSYKIQPGLHSDHSILKIEIGNNNLSRGKGFLKFNISLLRDKLYVEKIKEIIKTCEKEYASITDRGLTWELTKMEIRSYTLTYCVKKKKENCF